MNSHGSNARYLFTFVALEARTSILAGGNVQYSTVQGQVSN